MAQDFTKGGGVETAWMGPRGISTQQITLDFSARPATAAEVLAIFKVPRNTLVFRICAICHTPEGSAGNVDVGDGADVDGFLVDFNINSAASAANTLLLTEAAPNTVTGYSNGKFYAAEDTIDVIPSIDLDTAVVSFVVFMIHLDVDRGSVK